ncbi:cytoplasmic protein [Citrobacter farmeri]|uniref:Cytoplasmic protein n=1 Tax=Citrobacter amalonaticus Y19 TaxID=1261127 RepID=A0A0F6TY20_CITAM|nr:hypothetical protein [Citrobacter amalonaticus]AKE60989.1 cytoplasmic protein [Citrobacter amalonaticus Y19]EKV5656965.1 cytoplasmic protein [Citrobacter farmeri]
MTSLFTINCCKSFGCPNLGLASSPDYTWPDYRLGYAALHCRACGSYPPLFNGAEFRSWASTGLSDYAKENGRFCPACYQQEIIRYGHNPGGTQRVQCLRCKKVWTPKQKPLVSIDPPEQLATIPFIVPFQGASADQQLYVLLSFDAIRGNVLHISSNFTPHPAGTSLLYRWSGVGESVEVHDDIVQRVSQRETQFLRRSQFDEIQYGSAVLKRNASGAILRPVIAAHGHFRLLKTLFPEVKEHIVAHECFLRGAVITAWAERFRHCRGALWFVEETINDAACSASWQLLGKTHQGWWQNQWQLWGQGDNRKMVCLLTKAPLEKGATITLAASRRFITWLKEQPELTHSTPFSAGRVTQILASLAGRYNALLSLGR